MQFGAIAERELMFFFNQYRQRVDDIHQELSEMDEDISYPTVYPDMVLHQLRFHVPNVEDEVIRREGNREACQLALKKAHNRARVTAYALESLTDPDYNLLFDVYGMDNSRYTEYQLCRMIGFVTVKQFIQARMRALQAFYNALHGKRKVDVLEWNRKRVYAILKADGLENSERGKMLA